MNVTDAVLSATLRKLIAHGLVERKSYDEIPPPYRVQPDGLGTPGRPHTPRDLQVGRDIQEGR